MLLLADGTELNVADGFIGPVTRRGRTIVILGDCCHPGGACSPATLKLAANADVLVHEATLDDAFAALTYRTGPSDATYALVQQLLPGTEQDPTRLEMGRKYEEVDSGAVDRERGAAPTDREQAVADGAAEGLNN